MNVGRRKRIVVLGIVTRFPVAGVIWQTVHYLVGLERLGYDVYYVEAHALSPSMLLRSSEDEPSLRAAAFLDDLMRRFGLAERWAYHPVNDAGRCFGMSREALARLYDSAALILNLHGATPPLPEHSATGRLVYLETDPVFAQVELYHDSPETTALLGAHSAHLTYAENYGRPDCPLPVSDRFTFMPTRQPVVLDFWKGDTARSGDAFTTVGNWKQIGRRVRYRGETYHWSKHSEFLKVLDLPRRSAQTFELALSRIEDPDRELLERYGWRVRASLEFSMDPDAYRSYITTSRGEFTVAKDQNVRLRTGWFSDRSATYLAAGRPVITQDTGFGVTLPTGEGLFAFSTLAEIPAQVEAINADYGRHRQAAAAIAQEYFRHDVVLGRLLADVGL